MAISFDQDAAVPAARPWYRHLYVQVVIAIFLGVTIGHFQADTPSPAIAPWDILVRAIA